MRGLNKIVVIGPESTGKSTLCEQLSVHYNTAWCREYAREYLLKNGTDYSFDDLLTIAKGQLQLEEEAIQQVLGNTMPAEKKSSAQPLLFIDTDMYVMKVWCEFVFGKCHRWILDQIVERKYDLYLLCNTDLPWVKDELREYPDLESRQKLYNIYKDIMINQRVPWVDISGSYEQRFEKARAAVDALIGQRGAKREK
jgi:NadR type nicotinamide-nucleotide adenylyltransferase